MVSSAPSLAVSAAVLAHRPLMDALRSEATESVYSRLAHQGKNRTTTPIGGVVVPVLSSLGGYATVYVLPLPSLSFTLLSFLAFVILLRVTFASPARPAFFHAALIAVETIDPAFSKPVTNSSAV